MFKALSESSFGGFQIFFRYGIEAVRYDQTEQEEG
jgi:hypothetical protein